MSNEIPCAHSGDMRLVFPCSGAADVGEIADRAARMISRDGAGRMSCLAGVASRCEDVLSVVRAAEKILAIDGCNLDCAKKTLEQASVKSFQHLRVSDLGMEKGKTPVTVDRVTAVATRGKGILRAAPQERVV